MFFEWDQKKNWLNIVKHGISFEDAVHIFNSFHLTFIDSRKDYNEVRKISIGQIVETLIVVVVHTDRRDHIRVISARRANEKERSRYHEIVEE